MITSPARAGSATHRAVSISGADRVSVFCQENQSPKAPLNSSIHVSDGLTPPTHTNRPNSSRAAVSAITGSTASTRFLCTGASERNLGSHRPDHALDQVVHLFEFEVGLPQGL